MRHTLKLRHKQQGFFASVTIPAIASAAGAYLSYSGTQDTNEANMAIAQQNRDWQQQMANTAHQREVADLSAAGLNPILSVHQSGAVTPTPPTPTMINPMAHAATSGSDIGRNIISGWNKQQEAKNLALDEKIKMGPAALSEAAAGGVQPIKDAVKGAVEGLFDSLHSDGGGILDAVQSMGRKIGDTVSASSAGALDRIGTTVRDYAGKIRDAITSPAKYIDQRTSSAVEADRHYSAATETNLKGDPAQVRAEINRIQDHETRFKVMEAYNRQLKREGPGGSSHRSSATGTFRQGATGSW